MSGTTIQLRRTLGPGSGPLVLAIGNFDGVHAGHHAILASCLDVAIRQDLTPAVMTFEPLPRELFARLKNDPALAPPRLMSMTEKLAAFHNAGIRRAYVPCFNRAFAAQSPEDFIASLVKMDVRRLLVGEDFRFGSRRAGDVAMLAAAGELHGFTVETMPDIFSGGQKISSTAIRNALCEGRLPDATKMLGTPYRIVGRVTHGKKLGRTLGFPTANISLGPASRRQKPAVNGVFAVKCRLVTRGLEGVASKVGVILNGVANLGTNPVVSSENRHHLEVFLFDYPNENSGDLYGQRLEVAFIEKVRDEQKFSSLDVLVTQMHDDVLKAKNILRMNDDGSKG
ncbi:MAG: bifunctional riboflavin kinase/FAD synthetase [Betaproteobacteria bacterium]